LACPVGSENRTGAVQYLLSPIVLAVQ